MYRVVIVEDDPMVSLLNRTFVERDARFQVVQSFQDANPQANVARADEAISCLPDSDLFVLPEMFS